MSLSAASALLAGCGAPGVTPSSRITVPDRNGAHRGVPEGSSYRVLYRFGSHSNDGANPYADLTDLNGTLYGTTAYGGTGCSSGNSGCGTVYSISTRGAETVLYSFVGDPNGDDPEGGLASVNGTLYGTATYGGLQAFTGCGIFYSITTSGAETMLQSFECDPEGGFPDADPIDVKGILYGTTPYGGVFYTTDSNCGDLGCGVVYGIRPNGPSMNGIETVLHKFAGRPGDGMTPEGRLVNVGGTFYGTTEFGGASNEGIVFSISPAGKENVLYSFLGGSKDGARPAAGLVTVKGTLYGTTQYGGSGSCSFSQGTGCGTVFSMSTSGTESVLYSFGGGTSDGAYPEAGLIAVDGKLYGTTEQGGGSGCGGGFREQSGCGTVFSVTTTGRENVLHRFGSSADDGQLPVAGLTELKGTLYGTTSAGGPGSELGSGIVFTLKP